MQQAPQPGYSSVSQYYGVEVEGGLFTARRIDFFYTGGETQAKQLIGSEYFAVYQSRQGAYALSGDGKTLLFMHDAALNKEGLKKETGLYEHVHGTGERLIDGSARSGIYLNEQLPGDAVVFKRKNCPEAYCFDSPTIVRSTDGTEYIWESRPNKPPEPAQ